MPKYDITCPRCHTTVEIQRHINAPNPPCATCGGPVVQEPPTGTGFVLRGDGWAASGYSKGRR